MVSPLTWNEDTSACSMLHDLHGEGVLVLREKR